MKRFTMSLLGLIIVSAAGQARAGEAGEGTLDKTQIRAVVRAHITEIRGCYNEALARDPGAKGKVVLDFTIGTEGKVTRSAVESSDLADAQMTECLRVAVGGWSFPRPVGGALQVNYPFVFEPG